jgi:peptide/nickel transport system substrate-binding protein
MQRKSRLLFAVVGFGLLLSFALAACGPTPVTTPSSNIKKGGTLTDGLFEEPDSLLSNSSVETFSDLVDASIWTPLVYGDPEGQLHPGLLKEIPSVANGDISADALHYTLKLRSGLKWSDGQPLTADDVVFTLNLWNTPAYGAKFNLIGLPFIDFTTLKATDATTVTFTMKQVFVPLINAQLADPNLSPLPKHIFGSMDPASILKSNQNFMPTVSSGPFKVSDRVKGDHITVVKNSNYWQADQGYPYLDSIVFKIIPDSGTVLTALQSGQIDTSWFLDITKQDSYKAIQGYTYYTEKHPATFEEFLFNLHNPILADLQVRKAISMSVDIDSIITNVLKSTGQRTCDEDVGTFAHEANLNCYKFDPTTAKSILDADGWTVGSDGYRTKNGQTLELRWSTTANNARRQNGEQIAQSNLKDVGIKIDIINYPADTWFGSTLPSGDFDIGEFANSLGYDPDNASTWACNQTPDKGGSNYGFYCNKSVDTALNTEETNPDQNARLAAFKTFHQALLTDLPVVYLYSYGQQAMARNTVHNYELSALGPSETWNVWTWWKG